MTEPYDPFLLDDSTGSQMPSVSEGLAHEALVVPPTFAVFDPDTAPGGWGYSFIEAPKPGVWDADEGDIVGAPWVDTQHWHVQAYPDTCAVVAQEFVLDELTGQNFGEDELRQEAIKLGLYLSGGGTPLESMGGLLEAHGFEVERSYDNQLEDIRQALGEGKKVLVAVDADEIWKPGQSRLSDDWWGDLLAIPGQDANHAVQVIGIDDSDPKGPKVILNDPGTPDGRGLTVQADEFTNAWKDSGYYMVATSGKALEGGSQSPSLMTEYTPALRGYYNSDGTYHYTSDNTDRDPQTGAIVRRW